MMAQPDDVVLREFCTIVDSNKLTENYAMRGDIGALEAFDDEIPVKSQSDASVALSNVERGVAFEVKKSLLEDDQTGLLNQQVSDFVGERDDQLRRLALAAVSANGTGYDAAAFFSDSHPADGDAAAQDNNLAGSGVTTALVADDIASGISRLLSLVDTGGRMINKNLGRIGILAHPNMKRAVDEATGSALISNTSNVSLGGFDYVRAYCAELTDQNDIYIFNLSRSLKPILVQRRVVGEITDEEIKSAASHRWYLRVRNNAMLTRWQLGVRVVNS
jgi:phage major head subunit gpT-like protein